MDSAAFPPKRLIGAFVLAILAIHAFFLWNVRGRIAKGDPDFTVFYTAARIIQEHRAAELYRGQTQSAVQKEFATDSDIRRGPLPYIHPPFEALIFLPFSRMPYARAFVVWDVVNVCLLFYIWILLRTSMGTSLARFPALQFVPVSLAFFPVFANFLQGQDVILLLLVTVLGLRALDANSDFRAGAWFAAGLFKYHLVLPLLLILGLWRGRKFILGAITTGSILGLISIAVTGISGILEYPRYLLRIVSSPGHGRIPFGQLPNLFGLIAGWNSSEHAGWKVQGLVLSSSLVLLIVVAKTPFARGDRRSMRLGFSMAVVSAVLVAYSTNTCDLTLLILPFTLILDQYIQESSAGRRFDDLLLYIPAPLLISPLWFLLWIEWGKVNVMAVFLLGWVYAMRRKLLREKSTKQGLGEFAT